MVLNQPEPIYTYHWIVVLKDGVNAIPQFDPATGHENLWKDLPLNNISKVILCPFNDDLARKVWNTSKILAISTDNPIISVDVPDGEVPIAYRVHEIVQYDYYKCTICGTVVFWDGTNKLECPTCFASNDWYCKRCKEIIDNPIFLPNGEVRCPICEKKGDPYGLIRTKSLTLHVGMSHEVFYCIGHSGGKVRKYDDRGEFIEEFEPDSSSIIRNSSEEGSGDSAIADS
nr:hypothetical protein [Methanothrix sp.]